MKVKVRKFQKEIVVRVVVASILAKTSKKKFRELYEISENGSQ